MRQFLVEMIKSPMISFVLLIAISADNSKAEFSLSVDSNEGHFPSLISNSSFLHSPTILDFEIQDFLETLPGPLKSYTEEINGRSWTASAIIRFNSIYYGINPQLILLILEAQNELLTNPYADIPKKTSPNQINKLPPTLYDYVSWIGESLLILFDNHRYDVIEDRIEFPDGGDIAVPDRLNAGTYAVQLLLAKILSQDEWQVWVQGINPLFIQQYLQWFGDTNQKADRTLTPSSSLPEGYILPFTIGETWYYTSGPHNYYGGVIGCISGSDCPPPWSSIDIAAPEGVPCPPPPGTPNYLANRWVVAAKGGEVIQASESLVVIDHADGWRTYYFHMASADLIGQDVPVAQGQQLGHPSCEGGITDGVHVHFAIWQVGVGFVDINGSSLSNWVIGEGTHYNGTMIRNNAKRTADERRLVGTNDLFNSITLFSDTFSDGEFSNWTIVDAPGATAGPSDWSIVNGESTLVLLQDSNIYADTNYEGTYAYTGQSWWSNYVFNVDIEPGDNDSVFVLFRYLDNNNYYRFIMDRERNFRRLEKKVDGTYTTLAEDLTGGYGDGWISLQIATLGEEITVSVENEVIFIVSDSSFLSGMIGLGTWANTDCHFDNIIVATSQVDPYADTVVDSFIKTSGSANGDPLQILGQPQHAAFFDFLSIGGPDYWIVLDMGQDEEIVDKPGDDLRIYEIGSIYGGVDEEYNVSVSNSPDGPWVYIGQGLTTSVFDLAGSGFSSVRYIRIDDISDRSNNTSYPGSDIDAIQALSTVGDMILEAPRNTTIATVGNDIVLSWDPVDHADGYNIYASRTGSGVGYDLIEFVPVTTTNYTHTDVANDNFFYVVSAFSSEGYESGFSVEVPYSLFLPSVIR